MIVGFAIDVAARIDDVGENHGRAAEDIVFEFDAGVERNVVLNLDIFSDSNAGRDVDVLAEIAVGADVAVGHDVREMPDFSVFADLAGGVDERGRVSEIFWSCRLFKCDWLAMIADGLSRGVKNAENA